MTSERNDTLHQVTWLAEADPREVDAGAPFRLRYRVSGLQDEKLAGQTFFVRDDKGTDVAEGTLTAIEPGVCATGDVSLRAPASPGERTYGLVLGSEGVPAASVSISVRAHVLRLSAWGMPSAIPAGERFGFKVGAKCSAGCNLAGATLAIFDHEGTQVGEGALSGAVWPGTSALYFAEISCDAPSTPEGYTWQVRSQEFSSDFPHRSDAADFRIRSVRPPECELQIEVFDNESRAPIKGAHVLLHPYRGLTDENGTARLKVVKGSYRLAVSGFRYVRYEDRVEVASDAVLRAELVVEPERHHDYPIV